MIRVYTVMFRRVLEVPAGASNARDVTAEISRLKLSRLAAGTYYVVVTGKSRDDYEHAVSKPAVLLILR
jgi:hypothetical protein